MAAYDWERLDRRAPAELEQHTHWLVRLVGWMLRTLRPALGWLVFLAAAGLGVSALVALRGAGWGNPRQAVQPIEWLGLWMVAVPWAVYTIAARRRLQRANLAHPGLLFPLIVHLLSGPLVIAQILVGWLPGVAELWRAWRVPELSGGWSELGWQMVADLQRLGTRLLLWGQGVQAGGATQDDLVFLALALAVIWLAGGLTVSLVLGRRSGLVGALPLLWLIGAVVYYSNQGRWVLVGGLALAVALHLLLDQRRLFADWDARRVAYAPDVMIERTAAAVVTSLLILLIAAILPNLYVMPLARATYNALGPWNERLLATGDLLFPEMQRDFYGRFAAGDLGGLPNSFLLGAGEELGQQVVMQVRTNETRMTAVSAPFGPEIAPQPVGHYLRGATLSVYTGLGWENPSVLERREIAANQPWAPVDPAMRRPLLQSIMLTDAPQVIYAAPEPIEVGVATRSDLGPTVGGFPSLVALRPENRSAARSYTVLSSVPDVDVATLARLPRLAGDIDLDAYLELPDTISPRTVDLAASVGDNRDAAYAVAAAIEAYLRAIPYDLTVGEPPREVTDVADYFLFDLQRGYCDYYATAFIVLARLNGLPARFATGYAVGAWDATERLWTVTEAEAHSWPEVYFPQVGWVPFEPTAGRPVLVRDAPPLFLGQGIAETAPDFEPFEPVGLVWNPQMLIWLLPIGLLIWGMAALFWRWRLGREDAWLGLLTWGRRLGRPAGEGETELEYGRELADHVVGLDRRTPEQRRVVSREILALSQEAGQIHYGPEIQRPAVQAAVHQRWRRLRGNLLRLWWR